MTKLTIIKFGWKMQVFCMIDSLFISLSGPRSLSSGFPSDKLMSHRLFIDVSTLHIRQEKHNLNIYIFLK